MNSTWVGVTRRIHYSEAEKHDDTQDAAHTVNELLDLSVIVVNYNVRDFLEHALESVERASVGITCEVFVVDNDSADGSIDMVAERFPETTVIANRENVGFSTANNQAIKVARGRYILLLNPDTIVQEDTFRVMIQFMEKHPDAGAVGCKILNPDGTFAPESRRSFPTPSVAIPRILGLSRLFPKSRRFGKYNMTYLPVDEVTEVDALSGSCMLLRRAALAGERDENGELSLLFDEQFFMYGEDLDLCYRIQLAGWKLYYTPATQIIHYKGESTKKGDLRYVRLFYGAMLRFTEKHFEGQYSWLFRSAVRTGIVVRGAVSAVGRLARRAAPVVADFLLVYGVVAVAALIRFREFPPQILYTVAPTYAGATIAAMGMLGAYRMSRRYRIRLVVYSVLCALLVVATVSFFLKQIAYSRAVVLASAPASMAMLSLWRLIKRGSTDDLPEAIIVGTADEAARVEAQLRAHPSPPFHLAGYVCEDETSNPARTVRRLGFTRQLRDVVRLCRANAVVFAGGSNSRQDIFGWMQELRDLPVTFRMLDTRESYVIGKSSIDQLSMGEFVEADVALGIRRSSWSHRIFDLVFAIVGLVLSPVVFLGALTGNPRFQFAVRIVKRLPAVLSGRMAVVGYNSNNPYRPPQNWGLRPGVVPVISQHEVDLTETDVKQTYGYYAMNQSATADWAIVRRALRNPLHSSPPPQNHGN